MSQSPICDAIRSRNLLRINYSGDNAPGYRIVEPHTLGYNTADHLSLNGWFLAGMSESQEGEGWRDYLLSEIASITPLPQKFSGPRPGYK
jgi:hypothetical protein